MDGPQTTGASMQAIVIEERVIQVLKSGADRLKRCEASHLCCACEGQLKQQLDRNGTVVGFVQIRHCHPGCYQATWRAIKLGLTTEKSRVSEGKLAPRGKPGPRPTNPVTVELA